MTKQSRVLPEYKLNEDTVAKIPLFREKLLTWFVENGRSFPWREQGRTAYEMLIAEILLQRTTAAKVAREYEFFLEKYSSWSSLAQAEPKGLENFLKPLGLWQQKALSLQALSIAMDKLNGSLPSSRSELERLPGISQYIASAFLLMFYGQPEPLLDVNMSRVLERFFGPRVIVDIRYDPYLQTLSRWVVKSEKSLQINWAILDLGALICKGKTPICQNCPVKDECLYYQNNKKYLAK